MLSSSGSHPDLTQGKCRREDAEDLIQDASLARISRRSGRSGTGCVLLDLRRVAQNAELGVHRVLVGLDCDRGLVVFRIQQRFAEPRSSRSWANVPWLMLDCGRKSLSRSSAAIHRREVAESEQCRTASLRGFTTAERFHPPNG